MTEELDKQIDAIAWSGFHLSLQKQLIESLIQRREIMSEDMATEFLNQRDRARELSFELDVKLKQCEAKLAIACEALEEIAKETIYEFKTPNDLIAHYDHVATTALQKIREQKA